MKILLNDAEVKEALELWLPTKVLAQEVTVVSVEKEQYGTNWTIEITLQGEKKDANDQGLS